jgi:hypothetical protein
MISFKKKKQETVKEGSPTNAYEVPWHVQSKINPSKHIEVFAKYWYDAIRLGAKALGIIEINECECSMQRGVPLTRDQRQRAVTEFVIDTFGIETMNTDERIARFIEEAIELAQAENMTKERVEAIVNYVFSRPKGDPFQELGGVGVTLLAYSGHVGMSADHAEVIEFERVLKVGRSTMRSRQKAKVAAGVAS